MRIELWLTPVSDGVALEASEDDGPSNGGAVASVCYLEIDALSVVFYELATATTIGVGYMHDTVFT